MERCLGTVLAPYLLWPLQPMGLSTRTFFLYKRHRAKTTTVLQPEVHTTNDNPNVVDIDRERILLISVMPSQPPIPHLLVPYVAPPPGSSLSLVTSVLSATGNWLVLRILFAALSTSRNGVASGIGLQSGDSAGEFGGNGKKVVLLSFLRGWDFWRSEAKRLVSALIKLLLRLF